MEDLAVLLLALLERVARASTLAEVNVAAGIAHDQLTATIGELPNGLSEALQSLLDSL